MGGGEYNNLIEGLYFDGSKSITINSPSDKMKEIYNTFTIIICFKLSGLNDFNAIINNIKSIYGNEITIMFRDQKRITVYIGSEAPDLYLDTPLDINNKMLFEIQINTSDTKYPGKCVVSFYYNGKYIGNCINDINRGSYGYNADYILNNINFSLAKGSYLYSLKIYNGLYHKNNYDYKNPFYKIEYKNIILQ